jgi:hypothetical protein
MLVHTTVMKIYVYNALKVLNGIGGWPVTTRIVSMLREKEYSKVTRIG